jgi:hypothetical protein
MECVRHVIILQNLLKGIVLTCTKVWFDFILRLQPVSRWQSVCSRANSLIKVNKKAHLQKANGRA